MVDKTLAETPQQKLFWPTFGLIMFLLFWLALCTSGFWYLYVRVTSDFADPTQTLAALQWMTWPFTVLCIAGPIVVVLSIGGLRVIRDLLQMQQLIINLPKQLGAMQEVLGEFKTLRAQLITDVSRARAEDRDTENVGLEAPKSTGEEPAEKEPHVAEFLDLYDDAKQIFYPALEDFNAKGGEPLIVQRGGANFGQIAETLRDKKEFDPSPDQNRRIAEYVIRAFELERQSRRFRSYLTREMVQDLRQMRSRIRSHPRIQPRTNAAISQVNA